MDVKTTKQEMCASLKQLMAKKPLEKITIREITDGCGLKRQAFYYHFADIYDLVQWMFAEEALALLKQHEGTLLWQEGLLQLFHYLQENKAVCLCALNSMGREHLKRFFQADIYAIIHRTVETLANTLSLSDGPEDIELMTHFYVTALAGLIESWLVGELDKTPEALVQFADTMLTDTIRGAALRLHGLSLPQLSV